VSACVLVVSCCHAVLRDSSTSVIVSSAITCYHLQVQSVNNCNRTCCTNLRVRMFCAYMYTGWAENQTVFECWKLSIG